MKFLYGLYGANIPVIREFDIDGNLKVEAGSIIRVSTDGSKISPTAIGYCLGVAAEDHSGEKDILNARSNGKKLRVDITGGGVYSVAAPRFTAIAGGTATKAVCENDGYTTSLVGSCVILASKGENSTNTDSVGSIRKITGVSVADGVATISLSDGGVVCEGDVYAIAPVTGFKGNVADDCKGFGFSTGTGVTLSVIGIDKANLCLEVLLGSKLFD